MRTKELIRKIKQALKEEHLYSKDELDYMKKQLNLIENTLLKAQHREYKGFGKK